MKKRIALFAFVIGLRSFGSILNDTLTAFNMQQYPEALRFVRQLNEPQRIAVRSQIDMGQINRFLQAVPWSSPPDAFFGKFYLFRALGILEAWEGINPLSLEDITLYLSVALQDRNLKYQLKLFIPRDPELEFVLDHFTDDLLRATANLSLVPAARRKLIIRLSEAGSYFFVIRVHDRGHLSYLRLLQALSKDNLALFAEFFTYAKISRLDLAQRISELTRNEDPKISAEAKEILRSNVVWIAVEPEAAENESIRQAILALPGGGAFLDAAALYCRTALQFSSGR